MRVSVGEKSIRLHRCEYLLWFTHRMLYWPCYRNGILFGKTDSSCLFGLSLNHEVMKDYSTCTRVHPERLKCIFMNSLFARRCSMDLKKKLIHSHFRVLEYRNPSDPYTRHLCPVILPLTCPRCYTLASAYLWTENITNTRNYFVGKRNEKNVVCRTYKWSMVRVHDYISIIVDYETVIIHPQL